ncbi:MAG: hypothetical protein AAB516_01895 [Patescibacteria group bacterium]
MLKITRQQALQRWDILPDNLKEALFSEQNADVLWRACEAQHLSEDKIRVVATLAGDVIMGFIHPEDLAQEIKNTLGINSEIAASISREIDRKIFSPIKNDLEKVYSPITEEREWKKEEREKEIVDLRTEIKKPEEIREEKILPEIIPIILPKISEVQPPKIEKTSEEIKPQKIEIPSTFPIIPILEEDQPKIIHEEKKITPLTDTRKRSLAGLFGFLKKEEVEKGKEKSAPPVKIKLETKESFAEMALPQKSEIAKTEIPKPRVVHYSDLRTPLSPFGATQKEKEEKKEKNKEIKPPENLPITESHKIESNVENEEDVIDLRTFEKFKKPQ